MSVVPAGVLRQHVAVLGKTRSGKSSVMRGGEGWVWSPEIGFGPKRVKFEDLVWGPGGPDQ